MRKAVLASQIFTLICATGVVLSGHHPPAHAQTQPPPIAANAEDQRRDDTVFNLQGAVTTNTLSIAKQWNEVNALKDRMATMQADIATIKTNTTAGDRGSSWLNEATLLGVLSSIGLNVAPAIRRRRRVRDDS